MGSTDRSTPSSALYLHLLGPTWSDLSTPVQQFHTAAPVIRGAGLFTVRRGSSLLARLLAGFLRLPLAGEAVPTQLIVTAHEDGEQWHRTFADRRFITMQHEHGGQLLAERVGLVTNGASQLIS